MAHIWKSSATPWDHMDPALPHFEKNPKLADGGFGRGGAAAGQTEG
jgi:hypothetical protein